MRLALTVAAMMVAGGAALAQTSPSTQPSTSPPGQTAPAANSEAGTSSAPTHGPAVAGRNSFTQRQAIRRIADAGYTDVTGLKKDSHGIWRGMAQRDGSKVNVSLDYQGNVTSQ